MDFDEVKTLLDKAQGQESRKSVDALAVSPSKTYLCFIELKSWELQLSYNGSEKKIRRQAAKYSSDLPVKLSDSMQICREITDNPETFDGCTILYILVTDISVADDGILAFNSDLTALAGTSSNLKDLCNSLSQRVMDGITSVETLNAVFIEQGMPQSERLVKLNRIAIHQMSVLENGEDNRKLLK